LSQLILGQSPQAPLSHLTDCIKQAATIGGISAASAVVNAGKILNDRGN
jgi:hypothetical protein